MPDTQNTLQSREQATLGNLRVLIAEDEPKIRGIISLIFRKVGAEVYEAGDGVQATEVMQNAYRRKRPIQLVILDLMMPRMSGLAVLRSIRSNDRFSDVPVIIMSGINDQREVQECTFLGIDEYIIKPPKMKTLVDAATNAIAKRNPSQEQSTAAAASMLDESDFTRLGYPICFEGFPREKSYPMRLAYFRCPICRLTFFGPRLLTRALKPVESDKYTLGLHSEGFEKDFIHYTLIETVSCPECLYTSDRTGFHRTNHSATEPMEKLRETPLKEWDPVFFQPSNQTRNRFIKEAPTRLELARDASGDGRSLFRLNENPADCPRLHQDAVVSYNLALRTHESLLIDFSEENEARIYHKMSGFLLKRAYCYELLAKNNPSVDAGLCQRQRVKAMLEAHQLLLKMSEIELRNIWERLTCLQRRFWVADELEQYIEPKAVELRTARKRAYGLMKMLLMEDRTKHDGQHVKLIENFLIPLENRMYELGQ